MIYLAAALWITITFVFFMFGLSFAYLLIIGLLDDWRGRKEHKEWIKKQTISGPEPQSLMPSLYRYEREREW